MNKDIVKNFLDACFEAKKITELMPQLPKGMKPRHMHVIACIYTLSKKLEYVNVKDVSEDLNVTMPSITKLINELEQRGVVEKSNISKDKRVISLTLTSIGIEYYKLYIEKYHSYLSELFSDIKEEDLEETIKNIQRIYKIMSSNDMGVS